MILIKTKKEIDYIRISCQIVAETLQLIKRYVRPGVKTHELDKIAEDYILSNEAIPAFKGYSQAGAIDFPGSICVSVDNEVVHGIPGERVINEGEIVSIDVGVLKNKYFGDAALTIAVGKISDEKQKLMDVTEKSLHLGIESAKAMNKIGDISFSVQQHVENNGYSIVRELCGHGVGKYLHEAPQVPNFGKQGRGVILKEGMTLAIEPMVNMGGYKVNVAPDGWTVLTSDNLPSAHFEHTIGIINGHPEILTIL